MEVDGVSEALPIAEAARFELDGLDLALMDSDPVQIKKYVSAGAN